ncbi:hypothetical protein TWF481_010548 [Arthrobotrys musiformis]|uniref:DUF7582 domain-containing protein n=1 Tax=Arthrobotrys musiformis TaxID=47236 RepID=A0AAV9W3W8_9PEZI
MGPSHSRQQSTSTMSLRYSPTYPPTRTFPQQSEGVDTPTLTTALSYISTRLLQKTKVHHTFIVTGSILFSLFFRTRGYTTSVSLLQTSTLSPREKEVLISSVIKAGEKYGIEREDWVNNSAEREVKKFGIEEGEVVRRSLEQGVVVYSGDGMTFYAVDFMYELRRGLWVLSEALEKGEDGGVEDLVELVRRLVAVEGKGRGLRRGVVEEGYGGLRFSDYAWMVVGREYERRFGERGLREDDEVEEVEEGGDEGILDTF